MNNVCPRCQFGRCKPTTAPFVTDFAGQPLVLSSVPASACDVCGWLEYDNDFLRDLHTLIEQHARVAPSNGTRRRQSTPTWASVA